LARKHLLLLQQAGYKPSVHLVALYQMDREHVARMFRQALAYGAKANGPRSACCAFSVKRGPMLQQAGYKPAVHLVALYQMDREHVARLFPQAQVHVWAHHK
jgi:hypothetical protein